MTRHDERICKSVQCQLGAYAQGELGAAERAQIRQHIQTCDACAQALVLQTHIEAHMREGLRARAARHRPSGQAWERLQQCIAPRPRHGPLRKFVHVLGTATAGLLATALLLSQFASVGLRELMRPGDVTVVPEPGIEKRAFRATDPVVPPAGGFVRMTWVNPAALGDHGLTDNTEGIDMPMVRKLLSWMPISGELDALSTTRPCASCFKRAPAVKPPKRRPRITYVVYTFDDHVPKGYCTLYMMCVQAA